MGRGGWGRCVALVLAGCGVVDRSASPSPTANGAPKPSDSAATNRLSREQVAAQAARLPPALREKLSNPDAERELLVDEARKRGLGADPDLRKQVAELEERLLVQHLLTDEEKRRGAPSDADARAFFDAHRADFSEPERIHLGRILVSIAPGASEAERKKARSRADGYLARLRKREAFSSVAAEGDGPERARGGDAGWVTRPEVTDPLLAQVAFGLPSAKVTSGVVSTRDGLAIVSALEHRPAHEPSYEEARSQVLNRLDPKRKREVFDALVAQLRRGTGPPAVASLPPSLRSASGP